MPAYLLGSGKEILFRDFAPDLDPATSGIVLDADNATPTMKGFAARNIPAVIPNSTLFLASFNPPGAYIANVLGVPTLFAAGAGRIFKLTNAGWVGVSGIILPPVQRFRFTQFADDVIVTGSKSLSTPLVWNPISGVFAPLGGSPPLGATTVISVGGFVVFFNGATWYSSAAGVDNNYTPNIQTLAATGVLYDVPGDIVAAAALYRSIIAFKSGAAWVGTFSGSPFTWSFQLISGEVGTYGQECVVTLPDSIAFLGTDDFYITTGYTPQRIPNSVKEWFFANANRGQLQNVCGWYDHLNSVIYWHFTSNTSPSPTTLDRYVAYNTRVGRWSTGYLNCTYVVPNTVDPSLPIPGANGGTSGGGYFFDTDFNLNTWDDAAGAVPGVMYVKTGFQGDESNVSQLLRFRAKWNQYPPSDNGQAFHTDVLGATPILNINVVKGMDDWYSVRQIDRWHQVQINSVGPAEICGYAYEARLTGTRGGGARQPAPPPTPQPMPLLIASGTDNLIVTSPDGVTWTTAHAADSTGDSLNDAAWDGNKTYVLAGDNEIWSSTDGGATWASRTLPANFGFGIATILGQFGIFKKVIHDGHKFVCIAWTNAGDYIPTITNITVSAGIYTAHFSGTLTVAPRVGNLITVSGNSVTGYNNIFQVTAVSSNTISFAAPINWIAETSAGVYTVTLVNVATGITNGDTVVIANNSNAALNGSHTVTGVSGSTFTFAATTGLGPGLNGTMGDNTLGTGTGGTLDTAVAQRQGVVGTSTDGVTWNFGNVVFTNPQAGDSGQFIAIAYNGTTYVALEWNAFLTGSFLGGQLPTKFYSSTDLVTWTLRKTAASATEYCWFGTNPAGRFLALDSGPEVLDSAQQIVSITESATTATLTLLNPATINIGDTVSISGTSVPYYSQSFVVTNVISFTQFQFTATAGHANSYGGALSDLSSGTYAQWAAASADGISWTESTTAISTHNERFNCIWDAPSNQWIVAGTDNRLTLANGFNAHVVIGTSPDGLVWTVREDLGSFAVQSAQSVLRGAGGNLYAWIGAGTSTGAPYPQNGASYVSSDNGVTWTLVGTGPIPDVTPTNTVWTSTLFATLNFDGSPDDLDDFLSTSPDTLTWINHYDDINFELEILRLFS